jgi:diguanylate cyclase (GGDEF)-like protein
MSDDSLIQAMPDFVAFLRRDGVVLHHLGGRRLGLHSVGDTIAGRRLDEVWGAPVAQRLMHALRRALATRGSEAVSFVHEDRRFDATVSAHGRERGVCVIREASQARVDAEREGVRSGAVERREFFDRLRSEITEAQLREHRLALLLIHLDGFGEIGTLIDYSVSQEITRAQLARIARAGGDDGARGADWSARAIGDGVFGAIVTRFEDREELRNIAADLRRRLQEPTRIGDADFVLTPSIGVAIYGEDSSQAAGLLEHAQSAMLEARRRDSGGIAFYSDTLRLRSLARLDFQRELRAAIAADGFALRYAPRCELSGGELTAIAAYLRWPNDLRSDIRPSEFLPVAETTGVALDLSRWALRRLRHDWPALRSLTPAAGRVSFGALRQHFVSDSLLADVSEWLASGEIEPPQLELRLSEKTLSGLSSPARVLRRFCDLGITLIVDEFGRGYSSLPRLARVPVWGLQIDRALVTAARQDPVAGRAAQAALGVARALGLVPIASGIDDERDQRVWQERGCVEGLGDRFGTALRLPDARPASARSQAR